MFKHYFINVLDPVINVFLGGICGQNLEVTSGALKNPRFSENVRFYEKKNSLFTKYFQIFAYTGQFISARGNFLLPIGSDSFPILPKNGMQFDQKIWTLVAVSCI